MRLFAAVVLPTDLVERRQTCSVCLVERRQTAAAAAAVAVAGDDSTQLLPSSVAVEEVVEAVAVEEVLLLPMSSRGGGVEEDFETGSRVSSCSSSHSPTPLPSSSSFRSPPEDTCAFEVHLTNDPAQPHLEFVDCSRSAADCFPHRRRHDDVLVRVLVASACRVFFSSS